MKGILASYRWRRRFMWLGATTFLVVGAVTVGLLWPNTAKKEPGVSNIPQKIAKEPTPVRLTNHDKAFALSVVRRFVDTAVVGKNIDASWNLVAPEFRAGFTRKQWDTQDIPVVPFPARDARWKLQYADTEGVGFTLALIPTKRSHMRAQVFLIGLHQLGAGKRRHWVVDNWQPAPTSQSSSVGGGGGGPNVLSQTSPRLSPLGERRLSSVYLLIPVGLLSLILLVPLGIISVNWYRGHRAARAMARS